MKPIKELKLTTHNKWRKRYKCKKTKGDHTYELVYAWKSQLIPKKIMEEHECTSCGKIHQKWVVL